VLDCPLPGIANRFPDLKFAVDRYAALFVRDTGKGIVFIFLSCTLFASMWVNMTSAFFHFLAVVFNLFAFCIGAGALAIGIIKSQKLNKAKDDLRRQGVMNQNFPEDKVFTPQEFSHLTNTYGGYSWDEAELKLIMQALSTKPSWLLKPQRGQMQPQGQLLTVPDLRQWTNGGMVLL